MTGSRPTIGGVMQCIVRGGAENQARIMLDVPGLTGVRSVGDNVVLRAGFQVRCAQRPQTLRQTMIQMSRAVSLWARSSCPVGRLGRASLASAAAALVLAFTLAGCCGGGPSHKC